MKRIKKAIHMLKHKELYFNKEWSDFEKKYWKEHPEEKYCHMCGETKNVELHHIIPRHVDPSKILDENNLIPLCRECHFRFGHFCNFEKYYNKDIVKMCKYVLGKIKKLKSEFDGGGKES